MTEVSSFKELYPFESREISLDGLRYHYLDEGKGDPIVMLHGNPTWSFYYRNLILGLSKDYRCIAPDHIGCGLSDKPQKYNYTLAQHIENLEILCERLSLDNITLAVHDWGGAIGMGFALRHPEKIKRFVIFNTAAFLSPRIPLSINLCRLPLVGTIAIRCFNAFAGMAVVRACKQQARMTSQVKAGYLAPYDSYANRIANLRFVQDIPMTPDVPSYPVVQEIESRLHEFNDRPILIIWGKQDFCFDDHFLNRWKEIFPKAEVHEVSEAGHYIVEDAHEKIIPWMREFFNRRSLEQ